MISQALLAGRRGGRAAARWRLLRPVRAAAGVLRCDRCAGGARRRAVGVFSVACTLGARTPAGAAGSWAGDGAGRGLHSSTFQLNLSALYGIGGVCKGLCSPS